MLPQFQNNLPKMLLAVGEVNTYLW